MSFHPDQVFPRRPVVAESSLTAPKTTPKIIARQLCAVYKSACTGDGERLICIWKKWALRRLFSICSKIKLKKIKSTYSTWFRPYSAGWRQRLSKKWLEIFYKASRPASMPANTNRFWFKSLFFAKWNCVFIQNEFNIGLSRQVDRNKRWVHKV